MTLAERYRHPVPDDADAEERTDGVPGGLRLDLLEAFVALAEELHFTRAARSLFLSQSGLSRRINMLEALLGQLLLSRTTRAVELTPAGHALLPYAKLILGTANAATAAVRGATRHSPQA